MRGGEIAIESVEIERLRGSDKPELLELFTQAFRGHPMVPTLGAKPEATRTVMKAFLNFFGGTKSSLLYGIWRDNKLACASLYLDSTIKPSTLALIRFTFSMFRVSGWRAGKEFEVVHKQEPKYQ